MTRLVMIDHSLERVGGHHYEYAVHLLGAAEELGLEPILATHRSFRDRAALPARWRVLPLYPYRAYSRFCHAFALERARRLGRVSAWLERALERTRRRRHVHKRAEAFVACTQQLFDAIGMEPGDQVLLPTVTELDLAALASFLQSEPRSAVCDWHALLHYPIMIGREPWSGATRRSTRALRSGIASALSRAAGRSLHLYCTTRQLAAQYEALDVARFVALPYAVSARLEPSRGPAPSTLRVTTLGEARPEKGYHHLPAIVDAVWADLVETRRVRFVVQSSFAFPPPARGPDVWVEEARAALARRPSEHVEVLTEPLDGEAYAQLVQAADVGLLLHDRDVYAARCSGVLLEHLCAGTPVLVCAGSGLADELAEAQNAYVEGLRAAYAFSEPVLDASAWSTSAPGVLRCGGVDAPLRATVTVPAGATDLVLSLRWTERAGHPAVGSYLCVSGQGIDPAGARWPLLARVVGPARPGASERALLRLPAGASTLELCLRNAYGRGALDVEEVRGSFLRPPPGGQHPLGAIGLTSAEHADIPALLRDLVEHHAHYRAAARAFAPSYAAAHHPRRAVEALLARARSRCGGEADRV